MNEFFLAVLFFTSPVEIPNCQMVHWDVIRPSIVAMAVNEQILDQREVAYVDSIATAAAGQGCFPQIGPADDAPVNKIEFLRKRRQDMQNLPRLEEGEQFFGSYVHARKFINDNLAMNRAFRASLVRRLEIDLVHEELIRDAIVETDQLYQIWDTLRDASCDYYYVGVRREALSLLKELIGPEYFYSGRMPPVIPLRHVPRSN